MGSHISDRKLCSRIRLWELADQYILEPLEGHDSQILSITRNGGELHLISEIPTCAVKESAQISIIFGIVGIIKLLTGKHFLVITSRELAGYYRGTPVYHILSMKTLSCNYGSRLLTAQEKRGEAHLAGLLYYVEKTSGLYLSYDVDLTLNAQKTYDDLSMPWTPTQPLWKQADSRYLWNGQILEELVEAKLEAFILPLIQGSFKTIQVRAKNEDIYLTLIARRCNKRTGTRMWRRGADLEGHVANFVESEQLLEAKGHLASFVQVRGSIPVLWEQIVDLTYKPKIQLLVIDEMPRVVEKHFRDLAQRYGSVVAIDLVNQQGSEAVLSIAYGNTMQNIVSDSIRYVPFDFHRMCGQIRFDRLSLLHDEIGEDLKKQGFFLMVNAGEMIESQKGVSRTNCIDCLDRTNVTQSLFGRKSLEAQLQRLGIFGPLESISQHLTFDDKFKALWADHGDDISIQYSGTAALKGDYVRYGKRTIHGILRDGYNALARYYYNNLYDGRRQDALDLVVGRYNVSHGITFTPEAKGLEALAHLPLVSALVTTGITLTLRTLSHARQGTSSWFYPLSLMSFTAALIAFVRTKGHLFCSRPRLCKLS